MPDNLEAEERRAPDQIRMLVVDDEKVIRNLLQLSLERMGYQVVVARDGEEALALFGEYEFDLVLLDILMPGIDGFEVCTQIRKVSDVPVVMLTALNRPEDIVTGLELGADTYITKPFTFKEVEARIRAILRRASGRTKREFAQILEHGDVKLDGDLRAVTVDGNLVELTRTEYRLLHNLMLNPERPVSKNQLLETVWGYDGDDSNANVVELAIRRLRKKLEEDPSQPRRLVTVRGVGYKFCGHNIPRDGRRTAPEEAQHRRPPVDHWKPASEPS